MDLIGWSWFFLCLYIGAMVVFGVIGSRKIQDADDFATARRSYGPLFLALAFSATTASGATFLGTPGLAYEYGFASAWGMFLYPMGVYFGVLISMKLVATAGDRFGNRSIPEYLGDRYQSDGIRLVVSLFSLVLFFYIAGQLVSGLVMFATMLGLPAFWALLITTAVLLVYVTLGGAHADILTDGVQGVLMLIVAAIVVALFLFGAGIEEGLSGLVPGLRELDPNTVKPINQRTPLYHSWWSIISIFLAHIPLGLLPHIGNKLWALEHDRDRMNFVKLSFAFGLTLGMLALAGLLARVMLGDALFAAGSNPNQALPLLFIELFPTWLAALIGVGILSAIMSTADGLVISSSQVIANDVYRLSIVPRFYSDVSSEEIDRRVLVISRWSTAFVLVVSMGLAWGLMEMNVALLVWMGVGGLMAAFAGPLVLGALWSGVTRAGAYAGFLSGIGVFATLHSGLLDPAWFGGWLANVVVWLEGEGPNPYSCAAMGEAMSLIATFGISKLTKPLPESHLQQIFVES